MKPSLLLDQLRSGVRNPLMLVLQNSDQAAIIYPCLVVDYNCPSQEELTFLSYLAVRA